MPVAGARDEAFLPLGEVVHAGGGGEGRGVLSAAVQHHDQGQGPAGVAGGDIEPAGPGAGRVGAGEGVKPARRWLYGRGRGPVRAAQTRWASAGESAAAGKPARRDLPQLCPLAGAQRGRGIGVAARRAAGLLLVTWRIRRPPGHHRACQRLLDQRGCLEEAALAGQAGGLSHRCHLACVHGGIPSRGCLRWSPGRTACTLLGPAVRAAVVITAAQTMRAARAAFTAVGARKAPSTSTEAIVARASWGETSVAMLASPSTRIWIICPASRISSRSRRV